MAKIIPKKTIKKRQKPKPAPPKLNIKEEKKDGGPVDEKGNPFPIENSEGGDPICTGGYKIDYDFDPWNDPINPPFRCIQALKDPTDGIAEKMMKMANNPSNNVINAAVGNIPGVVGGGRGSTSKKLIRSHSRHRRRRIRRTLRHHRGH